MTLRSSRLRSIPPPGRFRTYDAAMAWLAGRTDYERQVRYRYNRRTLDLDRMRTLLDRLGRPERGYPSLIVAGTRGKGSACIAAHALLWAHGLRTGLFTSPHIVDLRERIVIDGKPISRRTFRVLLGDVVAVSHDHAPTFFELTTAMALLHFARQGVDAAVLEVGLGGRLDAVNAAEPTSCLITPIGADHAHLLGHTPARVAREKAGILRPGVPAWTAPQLPSVARVLRARARDLGTPLREIGRPTDVGPRDLAWIGATEACAPILRACRRRPSARARARARRHARFPARAEFLPGHPTVILDGGHDPESARALRPVLDGRPYRLCFGIARDKEVDRVIAALPDGAQGGCAARIPSPRAASPRDLLRRLRRRFPKGDWTLAEDPKAALPEFLRNGATNLPRLIAGSFYLVGLLRPLLPGGRARGTNPVQVLRS